MKTTTDAQATLAHELRKSREDARLSQEQLAELASTSTRPIYLFENSKASIRLDTYLKLLDALGLELRVGPRAPKTQQP